MKAQGVALAGAVASAIVAGCGGGDRGPFRIGVVVGGDGVAGARHAVEETMRTGGVDGRPVELVVIPHRLATAAQPSIAAADSLANDPSVVAVVGHSNSAASLAASQVYNARHLVHIAPTTTAPLFTSAGPYSFRLVPDDRSQAAFIARQVLADSARRIALVYVNDDYGRALAALFRDQLARAGTRPVHDAPYLEGADSAQLVVGAGAIARARPDVLVWLGRAPELAKTLGALPRHTFAVYGSDGVDVSMTYGTPALLAGVRFVRFVDPDAPSPALQAFRARYRAAERREVTTDAVTGYDAVMLIVSVLRDGARTREEVQSRLASIGRGRPAYIGLTGPISFDENGDVARAPYLAEAYATGVRAVAPR